jgi:enoyl-CoA hydratase
VALVRLNRPPVNALSEQVAMELDEAFTTCEDPAIRAVVVTGQPHFAAGADIKGFKETFDSGGRETTASTLQGAIARLDALPKPTIAAIHGYALGGGCELTLGCDFRYMAEDALIGQPEVLLGLIPGAGGTQRLQRIVGFQKAKDIVYTGRQVGADEARAIGYADKVAPADQILDLAVEDAAEWATKATRAIAEAKKALAAGRGIPLDEALDLEQVGFQATFATDDAVEGVGAFIEKREAEFKGS